MTTDVSTIEPGPKRVPNNSSNAVAINPMGLIQLAVEQGAEIEKLERLMDLRERWEAAEAKKAYDEAMAKFRAECPRITKNHTVDFTTKNNGRTTYKHATLDNICNTINPILGRYGLSYSWETEQNGGIISVTCIISHAMGHVGPGVKLSSGLDSTGNKNGIQQIGSTVTYLQRYTLQSALGLSTENDDDDGRAAGIRPDVSAAPASEPAQRGYITDHQIADLRKAIKVSGITEQRFCAMARIQEIGHLESRRFDVAKDRLKQIAEREVQ